MEYSKELHDRVRENLHMFDYPRFDDGDIDDLLGEIDRLTAANKWVSVKVALPECKKSVFISCVSPHTGNQFTQKAVYISPKAVLADDFLSDECDCSDGIMEYDDENDCYWVAEGWFEDSLEAEINYHITWEVTHWQPLPAPPTGGEI